MAAYVMSGSIGTLYGINYDTSNVTTAKVSVHFGLYMDNVYGTAGAYAIYTNAGMVRFGGEFACNGATPRGKATLTGSAAATYDATTRNLINAIAQALKDNGICQ